MKEQHDLAKWLEGKMTESELAAFEKTAEFAEYDKIKKYSRQLQTPDFNSDLMFEKIIRHPKAKPVVQMKTNWFLRIAAVLVIGLGVFLAYDTFSQTSVITENGKTKTFLLPDNSEVVLNSGSEITYQKFGWNNDRKLQLKGEAFFKVTKGKTFDVITNLGKITVVGTQFNVKARNQRFEVSCFEGKVRVRNTTQTVLLTKGQRLTFEGNKKINSIPVKSQMPQWLQDELEFNTEKLADVITELERTYDISIKTEKIDLDEKFTGTIPSDNLELALQIVSSVYHLNHTKNKNQIIFRQQE